MDRSKLLEFFDATDVKKSVHVVGCGAIGSHVCEELARLGFPRVSIYDFDTVDPHNITNQMFTQTDIGKPKVAACAEAMLAINENIIVLVLNFHQLIFKKTLTPHLKLNHFQISPC